MRKRLSFTFLKCIKPLPTHKTRHAKWLFVTCLSLLLFKAGAQTPEPYDPSKVIPPSPTAASLGMYGNYNVGYYSGRPDISIPLYEIKTANHSLPITLLYDASGVRASQQASWVGLSWSLSAGGVISRTVRGIDDFTYQGYYTGTPTPSEITLENKNHFDEVASGKRDGEADIFNYHVGSYSGKFVLGKKADGSKVFMDNANNLQIQYIQEGQNWVLTDGRGYKYYFSTQEIVIENYNHSGGSELGDQALLSQYEYSTTPYITTSWYLDSIASPSSETIKFIYELGSKSISFVQKSEKEYNLIELIGYNCSSVSPRLTGGYKTYSSSRQVIWDRYLKKILFQHGSIEFKRTDRNDIEFKGDEKPGKLSEVVITDLDNNLIKAFAFHHSYFNDNAIGRLKLDSLIEFDRHGNKKPPHKFSYFTNDLPNPYTKSIDHWGFYNGANNTTLIPEFSIPFGAPGNFKFFGGGIRTPDLSVDSHKKGVLSSISYPTGGVTQFDYDLHEYGNLREGDSYTLATETRNAIANPEHQTSHVTDTFTLNETTHLDVLYGYSPAVENPVDFFSIEMYYAYILNESGGTVHSFSNFNCQAGETPPCSEIETSVVLPAGFYRINVWYQSGWETTMSVWWKKKIPVTKKKGGGIRIKSIVNIENDKKANVKKFIYTTNLQTQGASTGKLISDPSYAYTFIMQDGTLWDCPPYFGNYLCRTSSSNAAIGLTSAPTIVGYDIVTEVIGENGEGGKIEHTFINSQDERPAFPYLPVYSSPLNGKLKQSVTFNAQGDPLSKVEYDYSVKEFELLRGIKLYQEHFSELASNYYIQDFYDYTNWAIQSFEKRTDNIDTYPLVTQRFFYYDNPEHKELTRVKSVNSDGTELITKFKYPGDYPDAGTSSFAYQMKLKNIVSPVIEEQTLLNKAGVSKLISGTFTKYKLVDDRFYKPESIFKINTTNPLTDTIESSISASNQIILHPNYKEEIVFDNYTAKGNLELFHKTNGEYQTYLWDYQSSLPVAHVTNSNVTNVACTSFESDGTGGWNYSGTTSPASSSNTLPTGKRFYNLTSTNNLSKTGLTNNKNYIISYWSKNGAYSITGGNEVVAVKTGDPVHGWTYFEHRVKTTGTTININGTGSIDEVRLYPATAKISTYTYNPLTGMTSSADTNGVITYFDYDGFQRLRAIKDQYGNVLKRHHYHYATTPQQ